MAPSTIKQWTVEGKNGFDSLKFNEKAPLPQLGDKDVLVKRTCAVYGLMRYNTDPVPVHAASLNFRDLIIPKVQLFPT